MVEFGDIVDVPQPLISGTRRDADGPGVGSGDVQDADLLFDEVHQKGVGIPQDEEKRRILNEAPAGRSDQFSLAATLYRLLTNTNIVFIDEVLTGVSALEWLTRTAACVLLPARLLRLFFIKRVDPESTAAILVSSGSDGLP